MSFILNILNNIYKIIKKKNYKILLDLFDSNGFMKCKIIF